MKVGNANCKPLEAMSKKGERAKRNEQQGILCDRATKRDET